jgi:hypothetical protein
LPQALENTAKIAEMVNIEIKTGEMLMPTFELPEEDKRIYEEAIKLEIKDGDVKAPYPTSPKGGEKEQTPLNPPLSRGEMDQPLSFNSSLLEGEIDQVPLLDKEGLGEVFKLKSLTSDEWYLRYQSFL